MDNMACNVLVEVQVELTNKINSRRKKSLRVFKTSCEV